MSEESWAGKRVLVTGADGFMGSHLCERLLKLKAKVIAFTRGTSRHGTSVLSLKNLAHVQDQLELVVAGNLAAPECVQAFEDLKPDRIMHLGAEAYVPKSFDQPGEVWAVNANGTLHVLEAARRLPNLERVVVTSSSEVYGTAKDDNPIDEDHRLNPTSPYAASKVATDRLAYSYAVTYGMPIAIIRPFNTFGPRHVYDVIPKFIKLALAGKDLTVYGDGQQRRDFTYVEDTVGGFLAMGSDPKAIGEVINFGSGTSYTIKHTAERIVALSGSSSKIVYDDSRLGEVLHLKCNPGRAKKVLGWEPTVEFDEGLKRNIEWERKRME
ncbi:MAG: GDP-mannose 4,6-dehydratase [Polyangiaceae bacterium]|nr:GDP-mannose 4,6-dehydratase [Polyangiaceae bacterium]